MCQFTSLLTEHFDLVGFPIIIFFVCSSVVCRHCVPYYQQYLCSLRSSVYNLELDIWLFSDAPSNNWLDSFKIIPKYPTEQLITQQPMTYPEIFQQDSQEVCWYLK